jgi:hypothetical protein
VSKGRTEASGPLPPAREGEDLPLGIEAYEKLRFIEAHDIWERIWFPRKGSAEGREAQALIQLAAAWWHIERDHPAPARKLLGNALSNFGEEGYGTLGLDLPTLRERIRDDLRFLGEAGCAKLWERRPPPIPVESSEP